MAVDRSSSQLRSFTTTTDDPTQNETNENKAWRAEPQLIDRRYVNWTNLDVFYDRPMLFPSVPPPGECVLRNDVGDAWECLRSRALKGRLKGETWSFCIWGTLVESRQAGL